MSGKEEAAVEVLSRDDVRNRIFAKENRVQKKEVFDFLGVSLELRQPTVEEFMNSQTDDGRAFLVTMLIKYAYIAGTETKVFDPADYNQLVSMPMSASWTRLTQAVQNLMDIKVEEKVKN